MFVVNWLLHLGMFLYNHSILSGKKNENLLFFNFVENLPGS
jgi:hypothetical protein